MSSNVSLSPFSGSKNLTGTSSPVATFLFGLEGSLLKKGFQSGGAVSNNSEVTGSTLVTTPEGVVSTEPVTAFGSMGIFFVSSSETNNPGELGDFGASELGLCGSISLEQWMRS